MVCFEVKKLSLQGTKSKRNQHQVSSYSQIQLFDNFCKENTDFGF